jgi:hypothetical protein
MPPLPGATPLPGRLASPPSEAESGKKLGFAQTIAALPADVPQAQMATTPQPAIVSVGPPVIDEPLDPPEPTRRIDWTETPRLSSLVRQWHERTRWQQRTWLGIWVVLAATLALLIAKLPGRRHHASSKPEAQMTAVPANQPAQPPPQTEVKPAPPPQAASLSAPAVVLPTAPVAKIDEPSSTDATTAEDLLERRLGYLTVHSTSPIASVFIGPRRYGSVEKTLVVPCGDRFIGIGVPVPNRKEPTWLAPSKLTKIPCGGSLEVTMNPRKLK